jgi:hypothetical protein
MMAKMKNFPAITIFICFALIFSNCKKTKHLPVVDLDVDSAVFTHFSFLPGTYWIYKDSVSGRTDSFFVRSNVYTKQSDQNTVYNYHLVTVVDVCLDTLAKYRGDSANWVFNFQGQNIIVDYYYGQTNNTWYGWKRDLRYSPLFSYPFQSGIINSTADTATLIRLDSNFILGGNSYPNVATIHHYVTPDSSTGVNITTLNDWFFINDDVGIVQMYLNHPKDSLYRVWKLLRYNINR